MVKPTIVRGRRRQLEFIQPPTFLKLSRPTRVHRYARKVSRRELGTRSKQEGNPGGLNRFTDSKYETSYCARCNFCFLLFFTIRLHIDRHVALLLRPEKTFDPIVKPKIWNRRESLYEEKKKEPEIRKERFNNFLIISSNIVC